eukprot:CAMPEP_0185725650 /NCGR_PEP_ID=MMETSP1171-20130828/1857_1 /TAXON_ID=374046 /ORGANISM="Helicotheca tamensis, Strain CCMP826" /LENGTH=372 /DNA_ID=CAMNT_0028393829 /DNA_START=177 /DNA_END=1295 /DNA_ORIENTATION=+
MTLTNTDAFGISGMSSTKPMTKSSTSFLPLSSSSDDETTTTTATTLKRKPKKGDIVTIDYTLTPEDPSFVAEPLFDTDGEISFVLHGGNYLPGLHELVSTMVPGESVSGVSLDAGWGDVNQDLIATVPFDEQQNGLDKDKIKVGVELFLANGMKCRVTEVSEENFTIDANHPMAGASYLADVTLVQVENGPNNEDNNMDYSSDNDFGKDCRYEVATFALGCFWGGELSYQRQQGVVGTKVGYTQGDKLNPTYKEVCSGTTGHTEAIQVIYDPSIVSFKDLVNIAVKKLGNDVYKLNQVGNDRGTQYRHGIYYHNDEQRDGAKAILDNFGEKCMTELKPAEVFYDAEDYHQQYLLKGGQSAKKGAKETIRCYG